MPNSPYFSEIVNPIIRTLYIIQLIMMRKRLCLHKKEKSLEIEALRLSALFSERWRLAFDAQG
jgi:hypothetical protein